MSWLTRVISGGVSPSVLCDTGVVGRAHPSVGPPRREAVALETGGTEGPVPGPGLAVAGAQVSGGWPALRHLGPAGGG